jgi:Uma2 family endonuclease
MSVLNLQSASCGYVVELLSNSTATIDCEFKKDLYQNTWRVPEYFWFYPNTQEFKVYELWA